MQKKKKNPEELRPWVGYKENYFELKILSLECLTFNEIEKQTTE